MNSPVHLGAEQQSSLLLRAGREVLQGIELGDGRAQSARARDMTNLAETHLQQLHAAAGILDSAGQILDCARHLVVSIVELQAEVAKLSIQAETSLAKLRASAPVVQRSLDQLSNRIDQLIDRAIDIDADDASLSQLELRNQLIELATLSSSQSQSVLMKFLSL